MSICYNSQLNFFLSYIYDASYGEILLTGNLLSPERA